MKKLRFNVDDLQVQSFDTTADRRAMPRGTVLGQTELPIEETAWNDPACNPNYTQGSSCQNGGESWMDVALLGIPAAVTSVSCTPLGAS